MVAPVLPSGDSAAIGSGLRMPPGLAVRTLRLSRGTTQRQLADRAGVSVEGIWTIENGRKYPRRSRLVLLAAALGVPIADLAPAPGPLPSTAKMDTYGHGGRVPAKVGLASACR